MSAFINIQVTFDKLYQFNLIRENLSWHQVSTVIQSSIAEAADKEPLRLYYFLNENRHTLSSNDEFALLLNIEGILGLRLYGRSQDSMEPVYILAQTNASFKKLSEFINRHHLESNAYFSKLVGVLASRIVYYPKKNFDVDFELLETLIKHHSQMDKNDLKRFVDYPKILKKRYRRHYYNMFKKMAHSSRHDSRSYRSRNNLMNNDQPVEFLCHAPKKDGRHRYHGSLHHHRSKSNHLNLVIDLAHGNHFSENDELTKNKFVGLNLCSCSESDNEGGCRSGRHAAHHGDHGKHDRYWNPFGSADCYSRFGGKGCHGRYGLGDPSFSNLGCFGGSNLNGVPKFGESSFGAPRFGEHGFSGESSRSHQQL